MKKYLNSILSMAALLMASATVFTACSNDDDIIGEQPAASSQQTYTMTINASKGGDATTRALSLEGKTLNATWATTENVYVKKGDTWEPLLANKGVAAAKIAVKPNFEWCDEYQGIEVKYPQFKQWVQNKNVIWYE